METNPSIKVIGLRTLDRISIPNTRVETQTLRPGSLVEIHDQRGNWLGRGFYNRRARVRLRVLTTDPSEVVDEGFFLRRLGVALGKRQSLEPVTNAYRVVHSEADGLPGLVVDRYADLFVLEFFSAGMFKRRNLIRAFLAEKYPGASFYSFSQRRVQKQESFDHYEDPLPSPRTISENGVKFLVQPGSGHKTGFFLDQRENRLELSQRVQGKSVLDLFCHSGGFGIYAAKLGHAARVVSVDRDPAAIELARQNAALNEVSPEFLAEDISEYFRKRQESFDVIVVDPPKQTRSSEGVHGALARYREWTHDALRRLNPGGVLVSCSCTGLVARADFQSAIVSAAKKAGKQIQIERWTGAGIDHPVSDLAPETRYLKVAWISSS